MEIVTKRFLLRDFVESDRLPFLKYQADPHNLTFHGSEESSPEQAARLFDLFQNWATGLSRLNYQLAIVHRQEPYALVGCCGLRGESYQSGKMELGIELAPIYWGRYGYAIEIGLALLGFGFRDLNLDTIFGSTVSANVRIARLAEWIGAEIIAIHPGQSWMLDRGWSNVEWRLTKEQWKQRTAELSV